MDGERKGYGVNRRLTRRGFMRGSFGAAVMGGLVMAGCSSNNNSSSNNKASNAGATRASTQAAAASASAAATAAASPAGGAAGKPPSFKGTINIGSFIDRSGATANVGTVLGPGVNDWAEYMNAQGGANGYKLNFIEFDHKYDANIAQQGYTQFVNQDHVVAILSYGTPITDALKGKSADDKIPMMTPGYGLSDSSDGTKYPYLFVGAASYQAQTRALLQYVADDWKSQGKSGNPKVVYVYYDNAAGKDPFPALDATAPKLNVDVVDRIPVPATAVDLTQQFQQAQGKNPDYVLAHLFGATPALGIKAWKQVGLGPKVPLIGYVWAFGESDIQTAGDAAEGYMGLQFTAMPEENPEALQLLRGYWKSINKPEPKEDQIVYYLRGVLNADMIFEAAKNAGDKITGETMKKGLEALKDFKAHGLSAGITMSASDHGGTSKVKLYQVKSGKITLVKDWFEGPPA